MTFIRRESPSSLARTVNSLLQWKPISERLLYVRLKSKYTKLSILVAYAPIEHADEEDKDQFYSALQAALEDIPSHDVLLVMGDFNARVGNINEQREKTMGRHGLGDLTNNGERLVDLCEQNDLAIGGTVEPRYNAVLGTMKITLLYQVSHYIRVKKQRNIKSWDQQNDLVIRGFCYIRPLYNEVPLYPLCTQEHTQTDLDITRWKNTQPN